MDKVIIDGVDVSGCEFIGDIKNNFVKCTSWVHNSKKQVSGHWDCRENKNCYYKQLQRLQAEYDDLQLSYAGCKTANTGLQELNEKLQQENERLKARLRPLEDSYFKGLSSIEIAELAKKSIRITAENRKLEYALQEIREYCEEQNLKADYTACEILDKINSVIGAEK